MSKIDQFLTLEFSLIFLLILISLGVWLQLALLRIRLSSRLARLEESLHDNQQILDTLINSVKGMADTSDQAVVAINENKTALEVLRFDVVRLADDVRGEVGMSRAIELARNGATKEAIAKATGLSVEESEAIVTFHGRKSPKSL